MKLIFLSIAGGASACAAALGTGYFIVGPIIGKIVDRLEEK